MSRLVDRIRLWRVQSRLAAPRLFRAFAEAYPKAFFVEIGANDGEQHDHLQPFIRSREWRGIMVEPVPYIFERLRKNYGELDRVTLENTAIAEVDETLPFYYLADADERERENLPDWYDTVGSFSREKVLEQGKWIQDVEERLLCREVPSMTFDTLCRKHGVERVDLLLLDTEGYDAEILRSIDFEARTPRLVAYEHFHLDHATRSECRARMESFGYRTLEEGFDTFCLAPGGDDSLDRAWRRLKPAVAGVSVHDEH